MSDIATLVTKIDSLTEKVNSIDKHLTERVAVMESSQGTNKQSLDAIHAKHRDCQEERRKESVKVAEERGRFKLWDFIWRGVLTGLTGYIFFKKGT